MAKVGAKNKYETLVKPYLEQINEKVRQGVTEREIAKSLGICVASLNNYRNKYPEFAEALSKDKGAEALQKLINSGIESACGCYREEEQTVYKIDENGEPVIEKVVRSKRWFPPNALLHKFYALNFGKEEGLTNDPLEHALRVRKQEFDEKLERQKNWDKDI